MNFEEKVDYLMRHPKQFAMHPLIFTAMSETKITEDITDNKNWNNICVFVELI